MQTTWSIDRTQTRRHLIIPISKRRSKARMHSKSALVAFWFRVINVTSDAKQVDHMMIYSNPPILLMVSNDAKPSYKKQRSAEFPSSLRRDVMSNKVRTKRRFYMP